MNGIRTHWQVTQFYLAVTLRTKIVWALIGQGALLVAGCGFLRELHFGSAEVRFLTDYSNSVISVSGAVLVAVLLPNLVIEAERTGTAIALRIQGASKSALLVGPMIATLVVLAWLELLGASLFSFSLWRWGHGDELHTSLLALCRGFLPLVIITSAAALAITISRRAVTATGITLGFAFAGYLMHTAQGFVDHAPWSMQLALSLIAAIMPDFALSDTLPFSLAIAYHTAFSALYAGAAIWIFSRRDF